MSIPKETANIYRLSAGEEIEVECNGASMHVHFESRKPSDRTVDLSEMDLTGVRDARRVLDKILGAVFKQGAGTVHFTGASPKILQQLQEILDEGKLGMYEDPQESRDLVVYCSAQNLQGSLEKLAGSIIKQIYRSLDDLAQTVSEGKLDAKAAEMFAHRDVAVNEHADICRRTINQDVKDYTSTAWYALVDKLEKIGDEIKRLARAIAETGFDRADILERTGDLFFLLFRSSSQLRMKNLSVFLQQCDALDADVQELTEPRAYHHVSSILTLLRDSHSDLLVIYL